jgi:nucleotide-binding universal stress UspA family protein
MHSLIQNIIHPTDFSEGRRVAFFHALKAALLAKTELTLLNVSPDRTARWSDFPGMRETLENWNVLPENSPRSAVGELGPRVQKVIAGGRDPVVGVLAHLSKHPADLSAMAIVGRNGVLDGLRGGTASGYGVTHWHRCSPYRPVRTLQMFSNNGIIK